jgi:hypothetical protein
LLLVLGHARNVGPSMDKEQLLSLLIISMFIAGLVMGFMAHA